MNLPRPKRMKRPKMGVRESEVVRSPGHMQFCRGFQCAIAGKRDHVCTTRIHAHHCREGADGGIGMKPGDNTVVPLCDVAHNLIHQIGWRKFEDRFGVDLSNLAGEIWRQSSHRIKWESRN